MAFSGANNSLEGGEDPWEQWVQGDEERSDGGSELIRVDPEVTLRIRPIQRAVDSPPNKAESEGSDLSQASEEDSEADAEERKSADEELLGAVGGWNPFPKGEGKENKAPPPEWNPWAMNWWSQEGGRQHPQGTQIGQIPRGRTPRRRLRKRPRGARPPRVRWRPAGPLRHPRERGKDPGNGGVRENGKTSGHAS